MGGEASSQASSNFASQPANPPRFRDHGGLAVVQPTKIPHLPAPQEEPPLGVKKLPPIRPSMSNRDDGSVPQRPPHKHEEYPSAGYMRSSSSSDGSLQIRAPSPELDEGRRPANGAFPGPVFTSTHNPSQVPVWALSTSPEEEGACHGTPPDVRFPDKEPVASRSIRHGASLAGKPPCIKPIKPPEGVSCLETELRPRFQPPRSPPPRPPTRGVASPDVFSTSEEDLGKTKEGGRTVAFADEVGIKSEHFTVPRSASRQTAQGFSSTTNSVSTFNSNSATVATPGEDDGEELRQDSGMTKRLAKIFCWNFIRLSAVTVPLSTFFVSFPGESMSQGVAGLMVFISVVLALSAKNPSLCCCPGDAEGTSLVLLELAAAICTATASETANFVNAMSSEERSTLKSLGVLAKNRGLIRRNRVSASVGQAFIRSASRATLDPSVKENELKPGPLRYEKTRSFLDGSTQRIHRTMSGVSRVGVFFRAQTKMSDVSDNDFSDFNFKRSLHRLRRSVTTKDSHALAAGDHESGGQEPFWRFLVDTGLLTNYGFKDFVEPMHSTEASSLPSVPHENEVAAPSSLQTAASKGNTQGVPTQAIHLNWDYKDGLHNECEVPATGQSTVQTKGSKERPHVQLILPGLDSPLDNIDLSSDAGISYCSATDGIDRKMQDVVRTELLNLGPGNGGLSRVQIEFSSACMRTRSIWQQHALKEQQALLEAVSSRLKKNENLLKFGDQVQEEQKKLLRGFRKIISRGADEDDEPGTQAKVKITVVERNPNLRQQLQELCQVLDYPCEAFSTLSEARADISKQPNVQASKDGGDSSLSVSKHLSATIGVGSRTTSNTADAGLWGNTEDWRPYHLFPARDRRGKHRSTQDSAHLVLLGTSCLTRELPSEWKVSFVSLASHMDEFEEVGRTLAASDEKEIRERLRTYGVNEYVLHPISLQSLQGLVRDAVMHRFGEDYLLTQLLGSGSMGCVYRAKRLRDGHVFALKQINTKRLTRTAMSGARMEGDLLRTMRWPTVLFLVDAWLSRKDNIRCLVMPLLDSGSLHDRVQAAIAKGDDSEPSVVLNPERVAEWLAQALHALGYLHWRGVLHRDLKPANMLLASDDRSLHISDFGSALVLPGIQPHPGQMESVVGCGCTPLYASPEGLSQGVFYAASDLWSLGVSFYEVATLRPLFPADSSPEDLKRAILGFNMKEPSADPAVARASKEVESELSAMKLSTEGGRSFLGSEVAELLQPDHRKRPGPAAWLATRPGTMGRVRIVLDSIQAFPTPGRLEAHFEALKRIAGESVDAFRSDATAPQT